METQFVEFTETVGAWPVGHIEPMRSAVAQGYITAGQAKPSDALAHMRVSLQADGDKRHAAFEERALALIGKIGGGGAAPKPPGSGGVDFTTLAAGTNAADEVKDLSLADAMRCMFFTQARGVDPALAEFGRLRLRHYLSEVRRYETNVNTGEVRMTIERSIGRDGKGLEVLTRDGTDSVTGGGSYGFTLKPNYIGTLYSIPTGQMIFSPWTEPVPMTQGNETRWPALGQFSAPKVVNGIPMPASLGGVSVYFKGETQQRTATDAVTRMIDFKAEDCTALTKFSRDYIVDNFIAMNDVITKKIGMAIGIVKDWTTIFGNGIGMPEGFTNSKAFIQRTRNGAGHIVYEDVVYMMSRMPAGCITTARWLTNQTTMPELMSIKDASGSRVFLPNSMITQADLPSFIGKTTADGGMTRLMGTLQGLPVYFSEYVPALGQANDIMLVCPSQYGLAQRQGLEVMISDQVYFETDEIGYKYKERFDGKSLWPSPYIQADNLAAPASGTQVSPFIGITVS